MPTNEPTTKLNPWKILAPILIVIALGWGGIALFHRSSKNTASHGSPRVGDTLADLTFHAFPSGETKLSKLGNKMTLINFWATWCVSCVAEMPSILKMRDQLKDRGFGIAIISVDENPNEALPRWLKKFGDGFSTFIDQGQELSELFDIHAIPTTIVVDKNRKVLHFEEGDRDWSNPAIVKQFEDWLAEIK